jgi:hypothetical protein
MICLCYSAGDDTSEGAVTVTDSGLPREEAARLLLGLDMRHRLG